MKIHKYDILKIDLNPRKWHTQAWVRPCVVIQSNIFNKYSSTILVVPLTSVKKNIFPSEFWIKKSKTNWLNKDSRFLWSQIITIDKDFIVWEFWKLEKKYYSQLSEAINISLDLSNEY